MATTATTTVATAATTTIPELSTVESFQYLVFFSLKIYTTQHMKLTSFDHSVLTL